MKVFSIVTLSVLAASLTHCKPRNFNSDAASGETSTCNFGNAPEVKNCTLENGEFGLRIDFRGQRPSVCLTSPDAEALPVPHNFDDKTADNKVKAHNYRAVYKKDGRSFEHTVTLEDAKITESLLVNGTKAYTNETMKDKCN